MVQEKPFYQKQSGLEIGQLILREPLKQRMVKKKDTDMHDIFC